MNKIVQEYHQSGTINNKPITEEFVQAIKQWVAYDDAIKNANQQLKEYRTQKDVLGKNIQIYMKKNHLENIDINITGGGKVSYKTGSRMISVNEKYTYQRLVDFFKGDEVMAKKATDHIYKNRERTTTTSLSRTRPRKSK